MRITSVSITPNTTTVGGTITVVANVLDSQGFMTKDKLLLKTKDNLMVIVKDT